MPSGDLVLARSKYGAEGPTCNVYFILFSMKSVGREGRVELNRGFGKGVKSCYREENEVGIALRSLRPCPKKNLLSSATHVAFNI